MDLFGYHLPGILAALTTFGGVYGAFAKFDADRPMKIGNLFVIGLPGSRLTTDGGRQFSPSYSPACFAGIISRSGAFLCPCFSCTLIGAMITLQHYRFRVIFNQTHESLLDIAENPDLLCLIAGACAADYLSLWKTRICPAPGSEDTELGVLMEPEVGHGEAEVYTRVQA